MMNKSKAQQQQQQQPSPKYQQNDYGGYGGGQAAVSPLPEVNMSRTPWTPIPLLTTESRLVHCQNCGKEGMTKTEAETGLVTWLNFCGLSMAGCVLGCCLIPFCVGRCKDVKHRCSSCHQVLARYERL